MVKSAIRAGILHDTCESAANKVNEIYEDPMSWWMSDKIQEAREQFCYRFARTSDNWVSEWNDKIKNLTLT